MAVPALSTNAALAEVILIRDWQAAFGVEIEPAAADHTTSPLPNRKRGW